jgi:Acyltransferase
MLGWVFARATRRLADIGVTFDQLCASDGFPAAAAWALANWCRDVRGAPAGELPAGSPLLIVSNHPGTYDALVITSRLRRTDVRIVASQIPFLQHLPHASRHFLFVSMDPAVRAGALRRALVHLKRGGSVLLYGSGVIDPDPALYPRQSADFGNWSRSIELFLKSIPQLSVLLSVVSHAVSPGWARNPIQWLRRTPLDRRRLIEFAQVMQQLCLPGSLYLSPRVSFSQPISAEELGCGDHKGDLVSALACLEQRLLARHLEVFGPPPSPAIPG